jgi:hypothetical protein
MTISYEVINVQETLYEDVHIYRPKFSQWELVDSADDGKGKTRATYQFVGGDPNYPATLRIESIQQGEPWEGKTSHSVRLDTWIKRTDSETSVVVYKPWHETFACQGPRGQILGHPGVYGAICNGLVFGGFLYPLATPAHSAAPATFETGIVDRVKFGIPTFDPGDFSDPDTP